MEGEDTDFDDGGGYSTSSDIGSSEPVEDTTSRSDVEEAVIEQKQDKGDPDPYRSDRGYLRGRNDTAHGGRSTKC
jgi:hypothetical protein